MASVSREFIDGLPKCELHVHVEGTLEPDLKLKLAQKNGIDIGMSTVEEVKATYQFNDLPSFLAVYYKGMECLQTKDDFKDLAVEYFKKAKANHVKRVEMFFDPQAHTSRGVPFEYVIDGYYEGILEGRKMGIDCDLIMCFLRDMSAESAMEHYEMGLPYRDRFIGIGLDSDEFENPPHKFAEVFARAKADGFKITMHCDIDQKDSIDHIRECLHDIKVDRLDHGTNIVEDDSLVEFAKENNIGLTCCPVSNTFCGGDMKDKEIKALLKRGVKVTANSDDPAYFQSYISNDLYELAKKAELTKEEAAQICKNAFSISWISDEAKANYIAEVDAYLAAN